MWPSLEGMTYFVSLELLLALRQNGISAIPECLFLSKGFGVFTLVDGTDLTSLAMSRLTFDETTSIARDLGNLLGNIHSLRLEGIKDSGARRLREDWLQFYREAKEQYQHLTSTGIEYVESVFDPIISGQLSLDYKPRLIHGDLGSYHIKADLKCSKIKGIIDFGEAGIGDAATDISCLIYNLGLPFVQAMDTYPFLNDTLKRAMFYAKTLEIQWFVQATRTKDPFWSGAHLGSYRGW
jgi:aminoglycoside 2''-phosphotransferase